VASPQQPKPTDVESAEALTILTLKYLDGALRADELATLETVLRDDASGRDLFVQLCHLHACLLENLRTRPGYTADSPAASPARAEAAKEPGGEDTVMRKQKADDTVRVPSPRDDGPKA
jgi:hypothetical protein